MVMDAFMCDSVEWSPAPCACPTRRNDFGGDGSLGLGEWGWCAEIYDDQGRPVHASMEPSKTYGDDAAGRRERLDDLGAAIAAAQARLKDL